MNRQDLIEKISEKTGFSASQTKKFMNAFFETVEETLLEGDKIMLPGFGNFEIKNRKAREARNPSTGDKFIVPEKQVPTFKFGKAFREKFSDNDDS